MQVSCNLPTLLFVSERGAPEYFHPSGSETRANAAPNFWTTFEISIGVLAACLPPLGPLIRRLPEAPRLFGSVASNLGLRSTKKRSRNGILTPEQISNGGWINIPDKKQSQSPSSEAVEVGGKTPVGHNS